MSYMIRKKPKRPKFDEVHGTYRADYGVKAPMGASAILEEEDEDDE